MKHLARPMLRSSPCFHVAAAPAAFMVVLLILDYKLGAASQKAYALGMSKTRYRFDVHPSMSLRSHTALSAARGFGAPAPKRKGAAPKAGVGKGGCPCHSGRRYALCCEPYHDDFRSIPSAEALLKARYAAMAMQKINFVMDTTHTSNKAYTTDRTAWKQKIVENTEVVNFRSLRLLKKQRRGENAYAIKFRSDLQVKGMEGDNTMLITEKSLFKKEGGVWYYAKAEEYEEKEVGGDADKK